MTHRLTSSLLLLWGITFSVQVAQGQCGFTISPIEAQSGCFIAEEEVVWTQLANATSADGTLTKTSGGNGNWNGGALSTGAIFDYGYTEMVATQTNRERAFGLTAGNSSHTHVNAMEYAFFLRNNGTIEIRESGANRGNVGGFQTGDTLRMSVSDGTVSYLRNGEVLYISTLPATTPLRVDAAFRNQNGSIEGAVIGNYHGGQYQAYSPTNIGSNPVYAWSINGNPVGTSTDEITLPLLADGDVISCEVTTSNGCASAGAVSNSIAVFAAASFEPANFYITGQEAEGACHKAIEQVQWNQEHLVNIEADGNNLSKIQGGTNWNAVATSLQVIRDHGTLRFTTGENNRQKAVGLSHDVGGTHFSSMPYCMDLRNNGIIHIYESGANRGAFGSFAPNDDFSIAIENGVVHYYHNEELLYVSQVAPALPMMAKVAMRQEGSTVNEVSVANLNDGQFIASIQNAGADPTFEWLVNGVETGATGETFSDPGLNDGDEVQCRIIPDLGGCNQGFLSNIILKSQVESVQVLNFFIKGDLAPASCQSATEILQWDAESLQNVTTTGHTIQKIQGGTNWNAGGYGLNAVGNDGSFRFMAGESNREKAAGLSQQPSVGHFSSIQFGLLLQSNGTFRIYESGANRGSFGNYQLGDEFEIKVTDETVHYYHNEALLYVSNVSPDFALYPLVALRSVGALITDAEVTNLNDGSFTALAPDAGNAPFFQWKVNGVNVGDNTPNYVNANLLPGDQITCELTPDFDGCDGIVYTSNAIITSELESPSSINFYVSGEPSEAACHTATEAVRWNTASLTNVSAEGNDLEKIQGGTNWNANASSLHSVYAGGKLAFSTGENNREKAMGLSHTDAGNHFATIQYCFLLQANGNIRVYESGGLRGTFGNYTAGDDFAIAVDGGQVKYFHNGNLLYVSTTAPQLPLIADAAMRHLGSTLTDVSITNFNNGTFIANADHAGDNPTYQWMLNGIAVGGNSTTYTNPSLTDGDVLTCTLSPDLGGCTSTAYISNAITIAQSEVDLSLNFYIENLNTAEGYGLAIEEVVWDRASLTNLGDADGTLTKIQGGNNWNGGASSLNKVNDMGYMEFTATETNRRRLIGLSHTDANAHFNTIQFGFMLLSNGTVRIYESGTNRGSFGGYNTGDIFRIASQNGVITYYRNGTLLYTSNNSPTLPLIADVGMADIGGTLGGVVVGSPTSGNFAANADDGSSPHQYTWMVNGTVAGNNQPTFSSSNLFDGDVVTCLITPGFSGCANESFLSNTILISGPDGTTEWTGAVSSEWSNPSNWSNGVPDAFKSAQIPSEMPHDPVINTLAQTNDLTLAPGASLTFEADQTLQLYGHFANHGSFVAGDGTVVLMGSGSRTLSGNNFIFNRAIVNMASPADSVNLESNVIINNEMMLLNGLVVTPAHEVIYRGGAESRFPSANSYIDGQVTKLGTDAFTFPIGRNGVYAPAGISERTDPNSAFTAAYYHSDPMDAGYHTNLFDGTINNVSRCEYWLIDRVQGNDPVSVTLSYDNERSCGINDPSELKVTRWNGTQWQDHGYLSHEGDHLSGNLTSGAPIGAFSPFTLASGSPVNPLPIELLHFDAHATNEVVSLEWTTASEINNDFFTLERSQNGMDFEQLATLPGAGNSTTSLQYHFADDDPYAGTSYYRLSQTDFDGTTETFPVKSVYIDRKVAPAIYPNPSSGVVHLSLPGNTLTAEIEVIDLSGKRVHHTQMTGTLMQIDLSRLAPGVYVVKCIQGLESQVKKLVLQ